MTVKEFIDTLTDFNEEKIWIHCDSESSVEDYEYWMTWPSDWDVYIIQRWWIDFSDGTLHISLIEK